MYSKSTKSPNMVIATDNAKISTELAQNARPFLKWAGGKGRLLNNLSEAFPEQLRQGKINTYIEPFVGGGAVLFHAIQQYPGLQKVLLADNNQDLMAAYWSVRDHLESLLPMLRSLEKKYLRLNEEKRQSLYYKTRAEFNSSQQRLPKKSREDLLERTAQLIFLNKTGFNGLFRVNSSGLFNVSFGKYENPKICDEDNLTRVSQVLKNAEIMHCDFEKVLDHADKTTFVYLDPPYRPISKTSNFTAYSPDTFTALDQERLFLFCKNLNSRGSKFLMNNSDPTAIDPADNYFHEMYSDYRIETISASRAINCRGDRRGKISELLIMNYGK